MHINAAQCNLHVNRVDDFDVHLARTGRFKMQVRSTRIGLIGPFGSLTTQELNLSCGFSVSFINLSFYLRRSQPQVYNSLFSSIIYSSSFSFLVPVVKSSDTFGKMTIKYLFSG